jgi:hypothetical protein
VVNLATPAGEPASALAVSRLQGRGRADAIAREILRHAAHIDRPSYGQVIINFSPTDLAIRICEDLPKVKWRTVHDGDLV